jgi:hypothetical protein
LRGREREHPATILYFLLEVLHQPYTEAMNMPLSDAFDLVEIHAAVNETIQKTSKNPPNTHKVHRP